MKLACVVHRFGADIAGGSEGHCRLVAEHLAAQHDVTIITTCAQDHLTWRNHYPAGETRVGNLRVLRFPVARERDMRRFMDLSDLIAADRATGDEQEQWFRENGPDSPELLAHLRHHGAGFDRVLFWAYRYAGSYFGLPLVADRSVLVPTAEEDPLIHVDALSAYFALPKGFLFLTPEEEALVTTRMASGTPSAVIGSGLDPAAETVDLRPLDALGLDDPFVLYLGRIDPNKGCQALIRHFLRYIEGGRRVQLVMAGPASMPIPEHPQIRALGFVNDALREALLTRARALMMPSPFESLSMVLLEGVEPRPAGAGECALQGAARAGPARRRRAVLRQCGRVHRGAGLSARPPGRVASAGPAGPGLRGSRVPLADCDGQDRAVAAGDLISAPRRSSAAPCNTCRSRRTLPLPPAPWCG